MKHGLHDERPATDHLTDTESRADSRSVSQSVSYNWLPADIDMSAWSVTAGVVVAVVVVVVCW